MGRGGRGTSARFPFTHWPFSIEPTITVAGRPVSRWVSATQARVSAPSCGSANSNGAAVRSFLRFQAG
ncbi:hypothetical protein, partial [Actinomadura kijaniata]|uniref:hypothetical protein n=1 Tax=Actinomadura kijaniata TaxID=46161 RepID=UPI0031D8B4EA